jgi:sulfite exporter TauE/SafE
MCGGITTMLTSAIDNSNKNTRGSTSNALGDIKIKVTHSESTAHSGCTPKVNRLSLILFYHTGRIASYCLIGAIVGYTGSIAARNIGMPIASLRLIAAVFLILLGLYIGQWLLWLNRIESLGKGLWGYLSPLAKHVIPVNSAKKSLGLGALWGWLPCGLVYSTLTWALASGSSLKGAAIMLFFGMGTLPALFTISFGINSMKNLLVNAAFRKTIAISLICYGIYAFIVAYQLLF